MNAALTFENTKYIACSAASIFFGCAAFSSFCFCTLSQLGNVLLELPPVYNRRALLATSDGFG